MEMQEILSPDAIFADCKVSSKKRLFKELAKFGAEQLGVDCEELQDALLEREDLGTTAMGGGIAIPHARIDGIDKVTGVFVRLEEPIDFDASDRKPVDLVFALFAPKDDSTHHLRALARISRVLRDPLRRDELRSTDDPDAIYAILTKKIDSVAA